MGSTNCERAKKFIEKQKSLGNKSIWFWLTPEEMDKLDYLVKKRKVTRAVLIRNFIEDAK